MSDRNTPRQRGKTDKNPPSDWIFCVHGVPEFSIESLLRMTIDIGIKQPGRKRGIDPAEPQLSLRAAPFLYLQPLLKPVTYQTGQNVELEGFAIYEGNDLKVLAQALADIRPVVEAQPDTWPVHVGTQLQPRVEAPRSLFARVGGPLEMRNEELYETVTRQQMLDVLTHWQIVVDRAQELSRAVLCIGG